MQVRSDGGYMKGSQRGLEAMYVKGRTNRETENEQAEEGEEYQTSRKQSAESISRREPLGQRPLLGAVR